MCGIIWSKVLGRWATLPLNEVCITFQNLYCFLSILTANSRRRSHRCRLEEWTRSNTSRHRTLDPPWFIQRETLLHSCYPPDSNVAARLLAAGRSGWQRYVGASSSGRRQQQQPDIFSDPNIMASFDTAAILHSDQELERMKHDLAVAKAEQELRRMKHDLAIAKAEEEFGQMKEDLALAEADEELERMKHDLAVAKADWELGQSKPDVTIAGLTENTWKSHIPLPVTSVILTGNKRKSLSVQGGSLFNKISGRGSGVPKTDSHETKAASQDVRVPVPSPIKKGQQTPVSNSKSGQQPMAPLTDRLGSAGKKRQQTPSQMALSSPSSRSQRRTAGSTLRLRSRSIRPSTPPTLQLL